MSGALLIDVDSTMPNLALMHLSTWRKGLGIETGFHVSDPDEVWASIVFRKNRHLADGLRHFYPNARIDVGGGGYDLHKSLPPEVDLMMPDYSLYPECDCDVGFSTRGCNRACYFCVVSEKEGKFRINQHPSEFHDPSHRKIVLLDNDILWDKDWFFEVTQWILDNGMTVDFNQGLDLRLMDRDIARRIAELRPIDWWHFAFDSLSYQDSVIEGIRMLKDAGVDIRHRANVYVYLHDDSQVEDALERCEILRGLNALPYVMVNKEAEYTRRMTDLKRWCRPQIFFSTEFADYRGRCRCSHSSSPAPPYRPSWPCGWCCSDASWSPCPSTIRPSCRTSSRIIRS